MASGPTQNYDDATLVTWRPRPVLATVVRVGLLLVPLATAVAVGVLAVRLVPPDRLGVDPWLWLAVQVAVSAGIVVLGARLVRRGLPLAALLRLTLVWPDRVPSRFAVVRRTTDPVRLAARVPPGRARRADGAAETDQDATTLLDLVGAMSRHDRTTLPHSERVQAYATLIAREIGLGRHDTARLGWAALLHDVGKLSVPREILDKPERPDAAEWDVLSGHAAAGGRMTEPLARWLGPWRAAVDQHHERWDGRGYPHGLAGEDIHLGARIVAVADAFDVITSARPYKRPLSADAARAELARCAGAQFDPAVVRAFLAVGLGELRAVAGPLAVLSAVPGLSFLPVADVGAVVARLTVTLPALPAAPAGAAAAVAVGLVVASPVGGDGIGLLERVQGVGTVATDRGGAERASVDQGSAAERPDVTPGPPGRSASPSPTDLPALAGPTASQDDEGTEPPVAEIDAVSSAGGGAGDARPAGKPAHVDAGPSSGSPAVPAASRAREAVGSAARTPAVPAAEPARAAVGSQSGSQPGSSPGTPAAPAADRAREATGSSPGSPAAPPPDDAVGPAPAEDGKGNGKGKGEPLPTQASDRARAASGKG